MSQCEHEKTQAAAEDSCCASTKAVAPAASDCCAVEASSAPSCHSESSGNDDGCCETGAASGAGFRRVLWAVLAINFAMFLIEGAAGIGSQSVSLNIRTWAAAKNAALPFNME